MAEFQIKIVNANRQIVAETFVYGETKDEVLEALLAEVDDAQTGESEWADGIGDDL